MKTSIKAVKMSAALLAMLTALASAGCSGATGKTDNSSSGGSSSSASVAENNSEAVKNDGYEKFSKIKLGMTEDEVNAILGEPVKVDKAYYYYNVTVNGNDAEVQVWINTTSGLVVYTYGDFYGNEYSPAFADSATDLSAVDDLESGKLKNYDDCAAAFKTPGYLISEKDNGVKSYLWVDSTQGRLRITFKADGTVNTYNGFC